jgi:HK97 gp10 family phage protein
MSRRRNLNSGTMRGIRKVFTGLEHMPVESCPVAALKYCEELARRVRAEAPVLTGELRASVEVERPGEVDRFGGGHHVFASVVVNSDHAVSVEYGTIDTEPNPFFRRAMLGNSSRFHAFVHHEIDRSLKKLRTK